MPITPDDIEEEFRYTVFLERELRRLIRTSRAQRRKEGVRESHKQLRRRLDDVQSAIRDRVQP